MRAAIGLEVVQPAAAATNYPLNAGEHQASTPDPQSFGPAQDHKRRSRRGNPMFSRDVTRCTGMTQGAASASARTVSSPESSVAFLPVNPMGILVTYIQADQVVDF